MSGVDLTASGANPLWLILIALVVGAAPILFGIATAYLKVSIVLGTIRSGLGGQQVPGPVVTSVLAAAITFFVMGPTIELSIGRLDGEALRSVRTDPLGRGLAAFKRAGEPWREFWERHAGKRERAAVARLRAPAPGAERRGDPSTDDSLGVLAGAFVLSELKEAFVMAFVLLVPFLVVDLVVANVLVGLGMSMVSPVMIALPVKLMLFTAADGWLVLVEGLVASYNGRGAP